MSGGVNCSAVDEWLEKHVYEYVWKLLVSTVPLFVVSVLLLVAGERLLHPLSVVVAGAGALVATYVVTRETTPHISCDARLIASGASGLLAAAVTGCLLRVGVVVLGAGAAGAVGHFAYEALPVLPSSAYYATVASASALGAVVSCVVRRRVVRVASAMLGAAGMTVGASVVLRRTTGHVLPSHVALGAWLVVATFGVCVQHQQQRRPSRGGGG